MTVCWNERRGLGGAYHGRGACDAATRHHIYIYMYIYVYIYIYVCLSHGEGGPGPQVRKRFWHTRLFFLSSRLEQLVGLGVEADPVGMSFASQAGLCKVTDRLYVAF